MDSSPAAADFGAACLGLPAVFATAVAFIMARDESLPPAMRRELNLYRDALCKIQYGYQLPCTMWEVCSGAIAMAYRVPEA